MYLARFKRCVRSLSVVGGVVLLGSRGGKRLVSERSWWCGQINFSHSPTNEIKLTIFDEGGGALGDLTIIGNNEVVDYNLEVNNPTDGGELTIEFLTASTTEQTNFTIVSMEVYTGTSFTEEVPNFIKTPEVLAYNDYFPYGSLLPNRHGQSQNYRYGFQGQEKDDEIKGEGNSVNYKYRMHDPRVGRFFAVDPLTKKYPHYSPYSFSGNKVVSHKELEGLDELDAKILEERRTAALNNLISNDSGGDHSRGIEDFANSTRTFLDNGRYMSAYALIRYAEGGGGLDIYDIDNLKGYYNFGKGYENALSSVGFAAANFLNADGSSEGVGYTTRGQNSLAVLGSDFGTTIGSFGMKYSYQMSQEEVDGETIVKGIVYFTFADTYRWDPNRNTDYGGDYFLGGLGNHRDLYSLLEIGASEYSIRAYFSVEFTYQNAIFTWNRMNSSSADELKNSCSQNSHPKLSDGAGYRLISGGETNDFRTVDLLSEEDGDDE